MQMWQMQEAKARLSEVVKCAETIGPQNITVHGQPVAVVISHATASTFLSPFVFLVLECVTSWLRVVAKVEVSL